MTYEPAPLTDREFEILMDFLRSGHPTAKDLLAFSGATTASGLLSRMAVLDPLDRSVLLTAIRKAIQGQGQV